jgi:hypothetical protein
MIDCWLGWRPPPKKPWRSRKTMSSARLVATPHSSEQTENMAMQIRK